MSATRTRYSWGIVYVVGRNAKICSLTAGQWRPSWRPLTGDWSAAGDREVIAAAAELLELEPGQADEILSVSAQLMGELLTDPKRARSDAVLIGRFVRLGRVSKK